MIEAFIQTPLWFQYGVVALLSLCVGSFLNVVIYRLPRMLEQQWQQEARAFLAMDAVEQERFNLAVPASACPKCQHSIAPWQNIPVLSYLFLKGRCGNCQATISLRYPLVELATALLACLVFAQWGASIQSLMMIVLTYVCIALALIDYDEKLLPDSLVLPLLWLGLLVNTQSVFVSLSDAVVGAAAGYGVLWSVFWLFKLVTGKDGMGYGDFKLMAAFGAWFGWQILPNVILLSSLVGAVLGIILIATGLQKRDESMPFGPFIIVAAWLTALYPAHITLTNYLG